MVRRAAASNLGSFAAAMHAAGDEELLKTELLPLFAALSADEQDSARDSPRFAEIHPRFTRDSPEIHPRFAGQGPVRLIAVDSSPSPTGACPDPLSDPLSDSSCRCGCSQSRTASASDSSSP